MRKITIKDVAREAGVSVTLVSFVMNAKVDENGKLDCPVNAETAARVLEVAKRLGYRRNAAAASLRSGRSNTIAVITTDISNKFFAGISRFIEDKAYEYGYTVLFGSSDERPDKLAAVMDTVLAYNVDGVIVAPVAGGEKAIARAIDSRVPIVLLDRDIEGLEGVGKVLLDDREAGRMATERLLDAGYKKIEMISYSLGISSLYEREAGYKASMVARGLLGNVNIQRIEYGDQESDLSAVIRDAIDRGVEAFFLPTYTISSLVLSAINTLGIHCPKDLAIVAFDQSDIYSLYSPSVAHIVQPLQSLGEKSVELLHNMIENISDETTIILTPEFVEGGSVEKTA